MEYLKISISRSLQILELGVGTPKIKDQNNQMHVNSLGESFFQYPIKGAETHEKPQPWEEKPTLVGQIPTHVGRKACSRRQGTQGLIHRQLGEKQGTQSTGQPLVLSLGGCQELQIAPWAPQDSSHGYMKSKISVYVSTLFPEQPCHYKMEANQAYGAKLHFHMINITPSDSLRPMKKQHSPNLRHLSFAQLQIDNLIM